METAAILGLLLLVVSEVLPYTPLKGNGIVEQVLAMAREVFPHKSHTDK
jgi:fumarate reductase subunit D